MTRYRWIIAPTYTRYGPWRDTHEEALDDAIEAGLASRDEHDPDFVYLDELVVIEEER